MAKRVVDTAITVCSHGTAPSALLVPDNHHRITDHKNVANISDHIPIKNIVPFGCCKSMSNPAVAAAGGTPQTCIPITPLKWQQNHKAIILDKEKILDDRCVCTCIWKGVIAITNAGQNSHFIKDNTPGSPSEEDKKQATEAMENYKTSDANKKAVADAENETLKNAPELEGAEHISQVEPNPGYETKEHLQHSAGNKFALPKDEAENFSEKPTPIILKNTKIYRVISPKGKVNNSYWLYKLPKSKLEWRSLFAVKKGWNGNGEYVEYTVGDKGLPAWEGKVATQSFKDEGYPDLVIKGGEKQIYIPSSKEDIADTLERIPTNWR